MNAKELLQTYLSSIQNTEAAAALFADDGVIELPTINARAQGPVAIQRFLTGLLAKVPAPMESEARHSRESMAQGFRLPTSRRGRTLDSCEGQRDHRFRSRAGNEWRHDRRGPNP